MGGQGSPRRKTATSEVFHVISFRADVTPSRSNDNEGIVIHSQVHSPTAPGGGRLRPWGTIDLFPFLAGLPYPPSPRSHGTAYIPPPYGDHFHGLRDPRLVVPQLPRMEKAKRSNCTYGISYVHHSPYIPPPPLPPLFDKCPGRSRA